MFCTNCGTKIEKGSFCPNCGTQIANRQQHVQVSRPTNSNPSSQQIHVPTVGESANYIPSAPTETGKKNPRSLVPIHIDPTLPQGMYRDEEGYIRWIVSERDYTRYFFMDDKRVGYILGYPPKKQTFFNVFVADAIKSAAGDIVMRSDSYSGQDLPWGPSDYEGSIGGFAYVKYQLLKQIKANRKKNLIHMKITGANMRSRLSRVLCSATTSADSRILRITANPLTRFQSRILSKRKKQKALSDLYRSFARIAEQRLMETSSVGHAALN